MNSLAPTDDQNAMQVVADAMLDRGLFQEMEGSWGIRRPSLTLHSGLPLTWKAGYPADAEQSSARNFQLCAKRVLDVVLASMALIALLPLFAIVAIVIALSSKGPVLFRQQREGLNGELFEALKFRSMKIEECDPSGVAQTMKEDPRVTPIGKFIRKTSIDELPQLINVLRGDMSLVGPRPHVQGMQAAGTSYKTLVPYYDERLAMRPGITGWAQANGYRGLTTDIASARGRVDHDIAYVQNFSLWLDTKIIVKTIVNEFVTGSGH